jgi:hypothetical protein
VEERAEGVTERVASTLFISCVFDLFFRARTFSGKRENRQILVARFCVGSCAYRGHKYPSGHLQTVYRSED